VRIAGIGTAVPPHLLSQESSREHARTMFAGLPGLDRLLEVFDNSGIQSRYLAMPPEWYLVPRSFPEKNKVWQQIALDLSEEAARKALEQSGLGAPEVSGVVLASTTGISTPSLDAYLIQRLDLPRQATRLPIWGLGCAGGVASLALAAELVRSRGSPVLVVAVELCSVTIIREDTSKTNLVSASLFADGAAAVMLSPDGSGPELTAGFSRLFDGTEDIVAWDVVREGLKVRLARSTPKVVKQYLVDVLKEGTEQNGLRLEQLEHFALHPGGARVLDAYREALGLDGHSLCAASGVLRDYGNMSSPTCLFVLDRLLRQSEPTSKPGILLAPGPGFSAEGVFFRW
jgi:alkylresorcinol/alkylpyrone synthase